ncbi:MAG TPA: PepSY domain-containing protein, partial [Sphingomicrobium sp.]|nr:PepSY domain-containing protein [Sphingomicrobium sp.]
MKLLSLLHRWAGGLIGLLLAVMGLSGAILVWEGSWIALPGASDPVVEQPARIAAIVDGAAAGGKLSRMTFASDEIGLHLAVNSDGSGAYIRQDGAVVDSWASQWERPELWLFDFHHHLFAGNIGESITGMAGIAG